MKNTKRMAAVVVALTSACAFADTISYSGSLTNCTAACGGFGSIGSTPGQSTVELNITVSQNDGPTFVFTPGDTSFLITLTDNEAPQVDVEFGPEDDCPVPNAQGQICNLDAANPVRLSSGLVEISGSAQIDDGAVSGGSVVLRYLGEPLVRNDTQLTIDLATGDAALTLLDGSVLVAQYAGASEFIVDTDFDGVPDAQDNCQTTVNSDQLDTNGDGFGNACDQDLNGDCIANAIDLGIFRFNFFSSGENDSDFNGDGVVAVVDLGIMRSRFFTAPGPSGLATCP